MPASAPYIPPTDAGFDSWIGNFADLIVATPADYGLVSGDATAIDNVRDAWVAAYALSEAPTTRTPVTVAAKDVAKSNATSLCRNYAQGIRNNQAVSDPLKTGLGLNIPPATLTPVPPPTSQPVLGVRAMTPGQATLTYHDSEESGKKKPYGCVGVDLHVAYGTEPVVDPDAATFVQTLTKSPGVIGWPSAQRGAVATIFPRYRTRSGPGGVAQVGPWGDPLPLTVT